MYWKVTLLKVTVELLIQTSILKTLSYLQSVNNLNYHVKLPHHAAKRKFSSIGKKSCCNKYSHHLYMTHWCKQDCYMLNTGQNNNDNSKPLSIHKESYLHVQTL